MSDIPGMAEGVQALSVMLNGTEFFLKMTGSVFNWSYERLQQLTLAIVTCIKKSKEELKKGEVNFLDILKKDKKGFGGLMQLDSETLNDFINFAQKNNLSYSIMTDLNLMDGKTEIAFGETQAEAFRYYITQNMDTARLYSCEEYIENADRDRLNELAEEKKEDLELVESYMKEKKPEHLTEIVIPSEYIIDKNPESNEILIALPNTEDKYISTQRSKLKRINDDLVFLYNEDELDEGLEVVDQEGVVKTTLDKNNLCVIDTVNSSEMLMMFDKDNIRRKNLLNSEKKEQVLHEYHDRNGNSLIYRKDADLVEKVKVADKEIVYGAKKAVKEMGSSMLKR